MNKTFTRRLAAAAGIAGVALMGLTTVGAGGATAGKLPGGHVAKKLIDGSTVNARLYDEFVNYRAGNVANIATSREVWVSGKIAVNIGGGAEGGVIAGGYVVGCQVNLSGVSGGSEGSVDSGGTPSASGSASISLGPGQAGFVPIIETTSGDYTTYKDYEVSDFTFKGNRGGVAFSQEGFRLNGCAGYASARARFTVKVSTDSVKGVITLWGKPFSIG
ncbi:MspA family porin [Gordonia sp. CPCC 205333]|uniref:MspA family porin n=1 Tax=Gordonia sp. CPCC 205333 TaxID=3140790 RepID=UPI003AF385AE